MFQIQPLLHDCNRDVGRDGNPYLCLDGVLCVAVKSLDAKVLFEPLKKQLVVFVLDRNTEILFDKIKLHSLCSLGYLSQVVKTQSLKKNALSVCSNLLKQINSKLGGANYAVDYDSFVKVIIFKTKNSL